MPDQQPRFAFFFYSENDDEELSGSTFVAVNLEFFKAESCMESVHLTEEYTSFPALPDWIYEESESMFSSDKSEEKTRQWLLDSGLVEDDAFTKFMLECDL